jgi:hypothetical protein
MIGYSTYRSYTKKSEDLGSSQIFKGLTHLFNRLGNNLSHGVSGESGFTLLEAVIASALTAGTLVILLMFSMKSMEITSEMNSVNSIQHSFRRVQREFVRDVQMTQYFFFGADTNNQNVQIPNGFVDRRVLTVGWKSIDGEFLWTRYAVKIGIETGRYYLLRTSNEVNGGIDYQTSILAPNVSDMYFVYYDSDDIETTEAARIARIEMTLVLADGSISEKSLFSGTLRGENLGVLVPDANLEVYQNTNFPK